MEREKHDRTASQHTDEQPSVQDSRTRSTIIDGETRSRTHPLERRSEIGVIRGSVGSDPSDTVSEAVRSSSSVRRFTIERSGSSGKRIAENLTHTTNSIDQIRSKTNRGGNRSTPLSRPSKSDRPVTTTESNAPSPPMNRSESLEVSTQCDSHERDATRIVNRLFAGGERGPITPGVTTGLRPTTIESVDELESNRNQFLSPYSQTDRIPQSVVTDAIATTGRPMSAEVRAQFESRLGETFSDVRIHTGPAATQAARALDTRAFTVGRHVVFDRNEYAPESMAGRAVLAEELVHVTQQRRQTGVRVDCWGGRIRSWWARLTDPRVAELDRRYPNIVREMVIRQYQRSDIEDFALAASIVNWQIDDQVLRFIVEHDWSSDRIFEWGPVFRRMAANRYSASDIEAITRYVHHRGLDVDRTVLLGLVKARWPVRHIRTWGTVIHEILDRARLNTVDDFARDIDIVCNEVNLSSAIEHFARYIGRKPRIDPQTIFNTVRTRALERIFCSILYQNLDPDYVADTIDLLLITDDHLLRAIFSVRPSRDVLRRLKPLLTHDWPRWGIETFMQTDALFRDEQWIRNHRKYINRVHPEIVVELHAANVPQWWIDSNYKQLQRMDVVADTQYIRAVASNWDRVSRVE